MTQGGKGDGRYAGNIKAPVTVDDTESLKAGERDSKVTSFEAAEGDTLDPAYDIFGEGT